jgi:alkanesulfonate monooxygenase SsuD/methylene tetrahydromethanopterin reductase-like flavin-dependent oxidoreductase (luciferase family)
MKLGMGFLFQNYTDWERFEALERGEKVGPPKKPDAEIVAEQFALADLVEPLGWDSIWAFEQHAQPYLMQPNPLAFLMRAAARTKKIDVGTMLVVLPWWNPIRLAEDLAYLQHVLGPGREIYFGVGRGLARRNYKAMGIDPDEARGRFNEVFEIVKKAFTEEMFSYEGEYYSYKDVSIRPAPLSPYPVLHPLGGYTSEPSLIELAKRGFHPLTTPNKTRESYEEEMTRFNEIRKEHGHGPANGPVLQVMTFCAESEAEAKEACEQWFYENADATNHGYEIGTENFGSGKGFEAYKSAEGSDFGDGTPESTIQTLLTKFFRDAVWGTPQMCAERIIELEEQFGLSQLVNITSFGTMPAERSEKSMRLFSEHVMPKIQHLRDKD